MAMNIVSGNDGANTLSGTGGDDLIYGYDPNAQPATAVIHRRTRVASGLSQPLYVTAAPGDTSRLFIVEKGGLIKILDLNSGQVLATPFLTVPVNVASERGLLGLAFDPDYATNGAFYVYATSTAGSPHNEVWRYHVSGNPNRRGGRPRPDPRCRPLDQRQPQCRLDGVRAGRHALHRVGRRRRRGERAGQHQPARQDAAHRRRSGRAGLSDPGRQSVRRHGRRRAGEIWAFGLRNPWRASFDSATGTFFIGNVGESSFEEINLGQKGANYGWPNVEGVANNPSFVDPIHTYPHGSGASVTGGYVYRGESDGLQGHYFFADFIQNTISTLRFDGANWVATDRTSQIVPNAGTVEFAGLVRRGRARQSLCGRHRRRRCSA